jgi:thiamine-phosphate pyrophosphorylase
MSAVACHVAMREALSRGFYAVLDREDETLARTLVGRHGARVLQVRLKPAAVDDTVRVARMARRVCTESGALLVINDRIDIALAVGADGVHLGQSDLPLAAARAIVGDRLALGVSTHDLEQVACAVVQSPAYIAYGPVFATSTKVNPDPVQGLVALQAAVATAGDVPVVAIGGITPERAAAVRATGVTAVCAIGAITDAADVAAAILRLRLAMLHDE